MARLNPSWNQAYNDDTLMAGFLKAVELTGVCVEQQAFMQCVWGRPSTRRMCATATCVAQLLAPVTTHKVPSAATTLAVRNKTIVLTVLLPFTPPLNNTGSEFAEAVHYVANVWLPAKQVGGTCRPPSSQHQLAANLTLHHACHL